MASTKLNWIASRRSGWANVVRCFFFFCDAGWSLRLYLAAFWEVWAWRTWRGWEGEGAAVKAGVARRRKVVGVVRERQEGQ